MPTAYTDPELDDVKIALQHGVTDPSMLVEPGWTPEQKVRWSNLFVKHLEHQRVIDEPAQAQRAEVERRAAGHGLEPPLVRDVWSGVGQAGKDLVGLAMRPMNYEAADQLNREMNLDEQAASLADSRDSIPDFLQSGVRGATRSVVTAYGTGGAGLGAKGIIATFSAVRGNQAISEADQAGLKGKDKYGYVGRAAANEAFWASISHVVGAKLGGGGGLESWAASAGVRRQTTKGILKDVLGEVSEEVVTEVVDQLNQEYSKVSEPLDLRGYAELTGNTIFQTLLTMGFAGGVSHVKRGAAVSAMADSWGWTPKEVERLIDRAEAKGGDFGEALGEQFSERASTDEGSLAAWAMQNERAALALAYKVDPSRKDFADARAAGFPGQAKLPADERARVGERLRDVLLALYEVRAWEEEQAQPTSMGLANGRMLSLLAIQKQFARKQRELDAMVDDAQPAQQDPLAGPEDVVATSQAASDAYRQSMQEATADAEAELAATAADQSAPPVDQGAPLPPASPDAAGLAATVADQSAPPADQGAPPPPHSAPAVDPARAGADAASWRDKLSSAQGIAPEAWHASVLKHQKAEREATIPGSTDWRTADVETLRGMLPFGVPEGERRAAEARRNALSFPVPNVDWRHASEGDLRTLLHGNAVHPSERKAANARLVELALPAVEARVEAEKQAAKAARVEKLRGQLQPFLDAWASGERDAATLTAGWPRGSEAGNIDFISADEGLEAGVITPEQHAVVQEGYELKKAELEEKRQGRKAQRDALAAAQAAENEGKTKKQIALEKRLRKAERLVHRMRNAPDDNPTKKDYVAQRDAIKAELDAYLEKKRKPRTGRKDEAPPAPAPAPEPQESEKATEPEAPPEPGPEAKPETEAKPGRKSRFLTDEDQAEIDALKKQLFDHIDSSRGAGIDPVMFEIGAKMAAVYVRRGVIKFSDYLSEMHAALGERWEDVRDHVADWWFAHAKQKNSPLEKMLPDQYQEALESFERSLGGGEDDFGNWARALIAGPEKQAAKTRAMNEKAEELGLSVKEVQERIESVLVDVAREVTSDPELDTKQAFDALVSLYERQPRFGDRTSSSKLAQAYSTPLPLAYAAGLMAGVTRDTTVYEPTAGFGALTIGADTANVTVNEWNELNDFRVQELRKKGFAEVTENNAADYTPSGKFQAVVANPPFGGLESAVEVDGFAMEKLEHLIAARALSTLTDDGRGVIIVGGTDPRSKGEKLDKAKRLFHLYLSRNFNLVGHYETLGKLYKKMGTEYPVQVFVVAGRKQGARPPGSERLPDPPKPEVLNTWEDVWSKVEEVRGAVAKVRAGLGTPGPGESVGDPAGGESAAGEPGGSSESPRGNGGEAGQGGERPGGGGRAPSRNGGRRGTRVPPVQQPQDGEGAAEGDRAAGESTRGVEEGPRGGDQEAAAAPANQGGDGLRGKPEPGGLAGEPASVIRVGEPVNDRQNHYEPGSSGHKLVTLTPNALAEATAKALARLAAKVGNIDAFVAERLGYATLAELHKGLAAEQIDGVALAIDAVENGRALIIGDQTGIGKGRQAAAMIHYARSRGWTPVFLTADPKLLSDIYFDAKDIGRPFKPLLLGNPKTVTVKDKRTSKVVKEGKALSKKKQEALMLAHMNGTETIQAAGYDVVCLPYSQLQTLKKVNGGPLGGERDLTIRQKFLTHLAERSAFLVLDESHKGSGDSTTGHFLRGGTFKIRRSQIQLPGIMRMPGVQGVTYLSATYAKRPETMALYFRTSLGKAVSDPTETEAAFKYGGVALQQWTATGLAEGGEMVRREKNFEGVRFDRVLTATDEAGQKAATETMDRVSSVLREINAFSKLAAEAIQETGDIATADTDSALDTADFTSVLHNYVGQILLASKVDKVVEMALESHAKGEAVVVALSNTMGTFMQDHVAKHGIKDGQPVKLKFSHVVTRALDRTMRASYEAANGKREHIQYTAAELGLEDEYNTVVEAIESMGVNLPASPIDAIHERLRAAGMRTGELTKRKLVVEGGLLRTRTDSELADKNIPVNKFNAGELDALIANASGATGLSIHASADNAKAGQKPRHMIVAQADLNIDTVMQMLGRILRTGIVPSPAKGARYTFALAPVEAEKRPAAVLAKKLASLNANTTAGKKGDVDLGAVELLNKYGDRVVSEVLKDDYVLCKELDLMDAFGSTVVMQDAAKKATGRLAILPSEVQKRFYDDVTERYEELVADLKEANEYDLEVEVQDKWDAELLSEIMLQEGEDNASPFTSDLTLRTYRIKDPRKPMMVRDLRALMEGSQSWGTSDMKQVNAVAKERVAAYLAQLQAAEADFLGPETENAELREERKKKATVMRYNKERMTGVLIRLADVAGRHAYLSIPTVQRNDDTGRDEEVFARYTGVLTSLRLQPPLPGANPYSLSAVRARFAVEHPRRTVNVPVSSLVVDASKGNFLVHSANDRAFYDLESFGKGYVADAVATRRVLTGNLIRASLIARRGRIVAFKTKDGETVTGTVVPDNWSVPVDRDPRMRITSGKAAVALLAASDGDKKFISINGPGGGKIVPTVISRNAGWSWVVSAATRGGERFYLNRELVAVSGDWRQGGTIWSVATGDGSRLARIVDEMVRQGMELVARGYNVDDVVRAHGQSPQRFGAPVGPQRAWPVATERQAKIAGRKVSEEGVQPYEIVSKIEELWGVKVRGAATHRPRMNQAGQAGTYSPELAEIRQRKLYDVYNAIHEIGHHLDTVTGDPSQGSMPAGVPTELVRLGRDLYGSTRPGGGSNYKREGFAEFIREFLLGNDIQSRAPLLHDWFTTDFLVRNQVEAERLRKIEEMLIDFQAQTPTDEARAFRREPRREWTAGAVVARLAAAKEGLEAALLNASLPILRAMQATGADLSNLPPTKHPFMLLTAFAKTANGRTENAATNYTVDLYGRKRANGRSVREILEPVATQGAEAYEDFKDYILAERALLYYERGRRTGKRMDPGLTEASALALRAQHENRPGFKDALKGLTDFAHDGLHLLVEAGYMTREEYNDIVAENPVYVFLMRRVELDKDTKRNKLKGGAPVHRVRGGGNLPVHDPIDALLVQYHRITQKAQQHAVLRSMVEFYDANLGKAPFLSQFLSEVPAPQEVNTFGAEKIEAQFGKWLKGEVAAGRMSATDARDTTAALDKFWDQKLTVFGEAEEYRGREAIVPITIDGTTRWFQVEPGMLPIMRMVSSADGIGGWHGRFLRQITALQRFGITGADPEFTVRNLFRDTIMASITSDYRTHWPVLTSLVGAYHELAATRKAARHHAFGLNLTGSMHEVHLASEYTARFVPQSFFDRAWKLFTIRGFRSEALRLRDFMGKFESAPRVMEFNGAFQYGLNRWGNSRDASILAACASKDLTTDFTSGGHFASWLNDVVLFIRPAINGLYKVARSFGVMDALPHEKLQGRKDRFARSAKRAAALTGISLLIYYLFNRDDDDWQDRPAHEKWGYLHLGGPKGLRLPLPFEAGILFASLPVALLNEDKRPGSFAEALNVLMSAALPVRGDGLRAAAANIAALGPIVEVLNNKRWNDSPIVPGDLEDRVLEVDQYGTNTHPLSIFLGQSIGWSPAKLEHVLNGYTGKLYGNVLGAIETMLSPGRIRPLDNPSSIPVVGTLFSRPNDSRLSREFYDRRDLLRRRAGSKVATAAEQGELRAMNDLAKELSGIWEEARAAKRTSEEQGEHLVAKAIELLREHGKRDKGQDRLRGIGATLMRLTDPDNKKPDWSDAALEGVTEEEALKAITAEAKRQGHRIRVRLDSGEVSAFGRRVALMTRALRSR